MKKHTFAFMLVGTLATVAAVGPACVAQRPSRNGVFNENQYLRKDFLIRAGDTNNPDNGWFLKATVLRTSQPNPLGEWVGPGTASGSTQLVRFKVTSDKLQLVSMREIAPNAPTLARTEEVINAWPITNVDLKYRINLDGEKTNFYEENQELNWDVRQWVKLNLDKNDMSDVAPLGGITHEFLDFCTDMASSTTTLVPGSFKVDEAADYMQWVVNITVPVRRSDPACDPFFASAGYGDQLVNFDLLSRQNVSFDLMYSFMRAKPLEEITYQPMVIDEKDPIDRKYGPLWIMGAVRDQTSQMMAARQMVLRHDPSDSHIVFYFDKGFPEEYKAFFTEASTGVKDQTNKLFEEIGVPTRVDFKEWNDGGIEREYGDVRYNFQRWISGFDNGLSFLGGTWTHADPRTGQLMSVTIDYADFPEQDYIIHRLDAYLKMLGASYNVDSDKAWDPPPTGASCKDGETIPVVQEELLKNHNGNSSLYNKMQGYLLKPIDSYGPLGPQDFIVKQDDDFRNAYYTVAPYFIYADPDLNPYVIREGGSGVYSPDGTIWDMARKESEFLRLSAMVDRGEVPYQGMTGEDGLKNALGFLNNMRSLMTNHKRFENKRLALHRGMRDTADVVSLTGLMGRNARKCVNGKWQTKEEWVHDIITAYWRGVMWHEFGHALGLNHNFMASIDRPNFPTTKDVNGKDTYAMYSSSIMEYQTTAADTFYKGGWLPWDAANLAWIYKNNKRYEPTPGYKGDSISGQAKTGDPNFQPPWEDPKGFTIDPKTGQKKEIQFLFCDQRHLSYTPLCRMHDFGTTPSEILANDIDYYEWEYQWRNFRVYRKFWNNAYYASSPVSLILNMRRFLSLWGFDWGGGELYDTFRRIGLEVPEGVTSTVQYYTQLTNKFNKEASTAGQLSAAFHKAVIQQSAGERPYQTIYDKFWGDCTQQGIILDKLYAMEGWVGLWPTDNYDPNQAGGYISSYSSLGDSSYSYVAEDAVASMIGGQYDAYPYFVPFAVSLFAQDTHNPAFNGRLEVRDWIGGFVFDRLQDFLDYWRDMAIQYMDPECAGMDLKQCQYDPREKSDKHNEFFGPDKRQWIWSYIQDRNQWVTVRKDRNIASYIILRNYNDYVVYQLDDGHYPGGAYGALLPMKYFLDSFRYFN